MFERLREYVVRTRFVGEPGIHFAVDRARTRYCDDRQQRTAFLALQNHIEAFDLWHLNISDQKLGVVGHQGQTFLAVFGNSYAMSRPFQDHAQIIANIRIVVDDEYVCHDKNA